MIQEKLTQEELVFCENFYNPLCLAETLFSNYDSLSEFKENLCEIRMYQIPMLSFSPILDVNIKELSPKEKFELRKGADEIYNFGGRRFGKSLIGEKIDICLSMLYADNCWSVFSSADAIHLADILDCITKAVDFHPILHAYKMRFRASPKYDLQCKNGYLLQSVNMNIASKDSGKQWFGKHCQVQILEESSLENSASYDKRKDAISELGVIIRSSGMTNFTRFLPSGKAFYDPKNKNKILNLPQYVNALFDDKEDNERQQEFGGRDSPLYKIFVKGEVIEDGISEFQIDRIEPYIDDKVELKVFEIKKKTLFNPLNQTSTLEFSILSAYIKFKLLHAWIPTRPDELYEDSIFKKSRSHMWLAAPGRLVGGVQTAFALGDRLGLLRSLSLQLVESCSLCAHRASSVHVGPYTTRAADPRADGSVR